MFLKLLPSPALASIICNYWNIEMDLLPSEVLKDSFKINGIQHLVFIYGEGDYNQIKETNLIKSSCTIIGQATRIHPYTATGKLRIFGVHFNPTGFHSLFGISMSEILNRGIELESVIGSKVLLFKEQILNSTCFEERASFANSFFEKALSNSKFYSKYIEKATLLINESNGALPIKKVADHLCLTQKTLGRHFQNSVGFSPKFYSRIIRFNALLKELNLNKQTEWQKIVFKYNYYDQSHLIKDFIELTGNSPVQYFKGNLKMDNFFVY